MSNIQSVFALLNGNLPSEKIRFAEPIGLSLVQAYCEANHQCLEGYLSQEVLNYLKTTTVCHQKGKPYFPALIFKPSRASSDCTSDSVAAALVQTIKQESQDAEDFKAYLRYIISELLNNVSDHSKSTFGCSIAAQYYPDNDRAQVAITDGGCGLLATLSMQYKLVNEKEAIFKAIEREVTGSVQNVYTSGAIKNAGIGLFAIKTIIEKTNGRLIIASNDTLVEFNGDSQPVVYPLSTQWQGTLVAFELSQSELNLEFDQFKRIHIWATEDNDELLF